MFRKVGCVDVRFPKPQDPSATEEQDKILDFAMENYMEDFNLVESDEEGKQTMNVRKRDNQNLSLNLSQ